MSKSKVFKLIDKMTSALDFSDGGDRKPGPDLAADFASVAEIVGKSPRSLDASVCAAAADLARELAEGQGNPDEDLTDLAAMIAALRISLADQCAPEDAGYPARFLPGTGAAPQAGTDEPPLVEESIVAEFLTRQLDALDEIEKVLLAVEEGADEGDDEGLLRFFHTLKGESALLGMAGVADVCHAAEDTMQNEDLKACADRLIEVKDWLAGALRHQAGDGPEPGPAAEAIAALAAGAVTETEEDPAPPAPAPETDYQVVEYVGQSILDGNGDLLQDFVEEAVEHLDASEAHLLVIEENPHETEALNAVFRGFHTIKGLAGFIELDHVQDLAHKAENLLDLARHGTIDLVGDRMDLVFESVDMMKRLVDGVVAAMGGDGLLSEEAALPQLMTRLVAATTETEAPAAAVPAPEPAPEPEPEPEPETAADDKPRSGFIPLGGMKKKKPAAAAAVATPAAPDPVPPATPPAAADAPPAKQRTATKVKEAMRVDADRLDHLIETIGELVIAESMVSQSPELSQAGLSVKLSKDLDHLDKICRELQEIGMSLRMVPVRPVFQKMARLVRDLSKKQDRKVDFVMSGEDTELDKNVVDKIGDPLVHMVRNSVDHGIEADPADRVALGKPERGRVELRAFHKGGNICIEIHDDGKGLDADAIRAKAISRGLLREGEHISDRELFNLIFEPGFSTAKQVTDISGRGVGMDVVRRNIEELRGTVEIQSEKGKGSVFSIKLPLTLAIIEGMVVRVGTEHYIVPTLSVVRLVRPRADQMTHVFDRGEMLAFEGNHLPLFRLSNLFGIEDAARQPDEAMVVVVEEEGRRIGLMADELLGQQSIVIKSLGESVQGTDGVAGGAIMSNGNVALILDIAGLVRVAHSEDTTQPRRSEAPAETEEAVLV